jgi:hypothetical protein
MGEADQVRDYVYRTHIVPARTGNSPTVTFSAGPIHKALNFHDLMPCVCDALDAKKFFTQYRVQRISRTGPRHGATATWVFSV